LDCRHRPSALLDFEKVRPELISNPGIPAGEIVVATGEEKGLEQIDANYKLGIADPACPVKFVISQKALAEGWDCPFPRPRSVVC
jgi:type III restriction enzyme